MLPRERRIGKHRVHAGAMVPGMNALVFSRVLLFGGVALSFPLAAVAVFHFGTDRDALGIAVVLTTSFWPLRCTRDWNRLQRIESLALIYLGMSYVSHLSWELGWVVMRDAIAASPDAPWAYAWWAYIDGGDARYATDNVNLFVMEILSVTNGAVGILALVSYLRSGRSSLTAMLIMGATAVVHLYSASLYYLTELLAGLPNVDTSSFVGTYIKFGLANLPWLVCPWLVFWWLKEKLVTSPRSGPRVHL